MPSYAHNGDAGLDVYSAEEKKIASGKMERVRTGIAIAIPHGFAGIVKDKSGMALQGMHCLAGVIDSGFRGELVILAINLAEKEIEIRKGQKIAQILIQPVSVVSVREAEELDITERDTGGWGSSGTE